MAEAQHARARLLASTRKPSPDSLASVDGDAIAVWRSGETDPVGYLAAIFDELPRSSLRG
ncbi:MAG: hypothetical protein JWQ74_3184 [Marmoricola sp.]|nr:hypothetical protein [Marmoricola sp.]